MHAALATLACRVRNTLPYASPIPCTMEVDNGRYAARSSSSALSTKQRQDTYPALHAFAMD